MENNGFKFDAFLLGYLGKKELASVAEKCFDEFSAENAKIIIDPVFGDNGKLYGGFDLDYVAAMRKLIKRADIILPNVTEACFLTGTAYRENHDGYFVCELEKELAKLTGAKIIITGVESNDGMIGEWIYGKKQGEILWHELLPVKNTARVISSLRYSRQITYLGKACTTRAILRLSSFPIA